MKTKLITEANEILQGTLNDDDLTQIDVISRLLEEKRKTLNDINQQVLSLCNVETIEIEIEESEEIVEKIVKCRRNIEEATRRNNENQSTLVSQPSTMNGYGLQPTHTQAKARLPKLPLPKFKGDVTDWTSFWDSFKSAVHSNVQLSNIDKFNYLNSLLEGTAARTIQGLTLSEANYNSAIEILQERFGRPQQIISAHMDEILKIQACPSERASSLHFVYDISVHVRGLALLGVSSEQYGSLLIPIVMSKLPNDIRLQIARKATSEVWKMEDLLDMIKKEIQAREASEQIKVNEGRKHQFQATQGAPRPRMH